MKLDICDCSPLTFTGKNVYGKIVLPLDEVIFYSILFYYIPLACAECDNSLPL
jgi:hypothetical protein